MPADEDTRRLAERSLAEGSATAWFERLYAEAEHGTAEVPWDRPEASALLAAWATGSGLSGAGRTALVVGCGLGRDAEFIAARGFATTAFDISETAVRLARHRHEGSTVTYVVADLLSPPPSWHRAFDLVVESNTVQSLPRTLRPRATAAVGAFVAPAGTLLVLAAATAEPHDDGPPWPLTRAEVESFAGAGLTLQSLEPLAAAGDPLSHRWRAVLRRP
jgi:SAM-dependent methyltransferase